MAETQGLTEKDLWLSWNSVNTREVTEKVPEEDKDRSTGQKEKKKKAR